MFSVELYSMHVFHFGSLDMYVLSFLEIKEGFN